MLTNRDNEIMLLIANFGGKTYNQVLEKTMFSNLKSPFKQAGNRVRKIRDKYGLLELKPTGLMNPKNVITLTQKGKEYIWHEFGIEIGQVYLNMITIWHTIYEQISFYWFEKLGNELERTIVGNWKEQGYKHTPDFYSKNFKERGSTYFEVETSKKQEKRYQILLMDIANDNIENVIFIFVNEKKREQISRVIPRSEKIRVLGCTIEDIVESCKKGNYPKFYKI